MQPKSNNYSPMHHACINQYKVKNELSIEGIIPKKNGKGKYRDTVNLRCIIAGGAA